MDSKIKHISLKQLSIQELLSQLPPGLTHLTIDKASLGPQQPNTFIVGAIQDVFQKTIFKGRQKKRMTLREVLVDESEGKQLDVFSYDIYALELESALGQDYNQTWIVFTDVHLDKYMGFSLNKEGWCELRISLRPNVVPQSGDENQPRVWLVKQTREIQETLSTNDLPSQFSLPQRPQTLLRSSNMQLWTNINNRSKKKTNYTTLNNCKDGRKQDVMAVVKEIAKYPTITAKGSYHTIIILVDPSCLEAGARREDVLIHVFLNDKMPSGEALGGLPGGVNRGDILRLHDMKGEIYGDKMHGKVFSALQVVKFSSVKNEPVSPISAHTDYVLSECDHVQVIKLRDWWESVSPQFIENQVQEQRVVSLNNNNNVNQENESFLEEYNLIQITKEMSFNLICQVLQVRRVSAYSEEMVILIVRDGTHTKVRTLQIDPNNATQELLTQTDYCTDVGSGVVEINVWVRLHEAKQIEAGGFYKLKKIKAIQHGGGENDTSIPYLEFIMNDDYCSITRLQENHSEVRKIKKRIEGKATDENFTVGNQNSFALITNDAFMADPFSPENNPFVTQQRKSPEKTKNNRINSQPKIAPTLATPTTAAPTLCTLQQGLPEVASTEGLLSHMDSFDQAMEKISSQTSQIIRDENAKRNNIVRNREDIEAVAGPSTIYPEGADRMDISEFPLDLPCSTQQHKPQQELNRSIHTTPAQQPSHSDIITPAQRPHQTNMKAPNQLPLDHNLISVSQQCSIAQACVSDSSSSVYAAVSEDLRLPPPTPSPLATSSRNIQPENEPIPGAIESRDGLVNKQTEFDKALPELKFEDLGHTGTDLGSYRVNVIIKEVYCMSSKPLENDNELGVSDWVWGVCIKCGECSLQSWEMREQYSHQDIIMGELKCHTCNLVPLRGLNKSRRAKKSTLHACMRLVFLVCNPEDEEKSLLVSLAGDHAHQFFGQKPQFSWILEETHPTVEEIGQRLSKLLDSNLSVTLGISKYILSTGITKFQITNTKLKV